MSKDTHIVLEEEDIETVQLIIYKMREIDGLVKSIGTQVNDDGNTVKLLSVRQQSTYEFVSSMMKELITAMQVTAITTISSDSKISIVR